ncbi:hypothetical protein BXU03_00105 [Xanthomonas oryzae pv. oryzae]|nr:hypothetical protein BXU03_00105 [Xanthomonas oryzae pv. oryzae]
MRPDTAERAASLSHALTAWSTWKQTVIVAAMAAGLLVGNAAWADHMDMCIVRDDPAGTPAIPQIHAWLQPQARRMTQPRQTSPPADAAALGAVRISTAIFDRPLNTRADTASKAAPLPARGQRSAMRSTSTRAMPANVIVGCLSGSSLGPAQPGRCALTGSTGRPIARCHRKSPRPL